MSAPTTRVVPDVGSPGKWVAQYHDPEMGLWFDIGDPRDTKDAAEAHLAEHLLDATMRAQLRTDPEAGGPRDPAIGPHPRFREMDAHRQRFLALGAVEREDYARLRPVARELGYSAEQLLDAVEAGARYRVALAALGVPPEQVARLTTVVPRELADTDPQRTPRGWQGGDS